MECFYHVRGSNVWFMDHGMSSCLTRDAVVEGIYNEVSLHFNYYINYLCLLGKAK